MLCECVQIAKKSKEREYVRLQQIYTHILYIIYIYKKIQHI